MGNEDWFYYILKFTRPPKISVQIMNSLNHEQFKASHASQSCKPCKQVMQAMHAMQASHASHARRKAPRGYSQNQKHSLELFRRREGCIAHREKPENELFIQ